MHSLHSFELQPNDSPVNLSINSFIPRQERHKYGLDILGFCQPSVSFRIGVSAFIGFQNGEECFLWNSYRANFPHLFLTFFLFFQ